MAETNTNDVLLGRPGGGFFSGPLTATVPTDASTTLDSTITSVGLISEDGYTNEVELDTDAIIDWNGDEVATTQKSREETFKTTLIETNASVLREVYGPDNVTVAESGAITVKHNATERPKRVYVFETLSNDRVRRQVIPVGKITEVGEITNASGEAIGYEITIKAYKDSAGNTAYTYIAAVED